MPKKNKGIKGKLTEERSRIICDAIRQGLTITVACTKAGIDRKTLYNWLARGRRTTRGRHADFHRAFREAEAMFEALATRSVRNAIIGGFSQAPLFDKDGNLIPQIDPKTGEHLRNAEGRPLFQTKWTWRPPDYVFAAKIMALRNPHDWSTAPKPSLDEELDRVEAEERAQQIPDHRRIGIPLIQQALQLLLDSGVDLIVPDDQLERLVTRQSALRVAKGEPTLQLLPPLKKDGKTDPPASVDPSVDE